jgi:thiol-disulfide isomerase/thioredoxin
MRMKGAGIATTLLLVIILPGVQAISAAAQTTAVKHTKKHIHTSNKRTTTPGFIITDGYTKTINITAQKGKVLFLNFWALSCAPCKAEMPGINRLYTRFKADTNILFLLIDLDHQLVSSAGYMHEKGFELKVYTAPGPVPQAFFKGQIPTTVIIDKSGKTLFFHEGEQQYDTAQFIKLIEDAAKR